MDITLYKNEADHARVNKSAYLSDPETLTGTPVPPMDICQPIIDIKSDTTPTANYCYIDDFGERYYFVDRIVWQGGDVFRLYLSVDPLYSRETEIKNLYAFVERNANTYNEDISDAAAPPGLIPFHSRYNATAVSDWSGTLSGYPGTGYHIIVAVNATYFVGYDDEEYYGETPLIYLAMTPAYFAEFMQKLKIGLASILGRFVGYEVFADAFVGAWWSPMAVDLTGKLHVKQLVWRQNLVELISTTLNIDAYYIAPGNDKTLTWRIKVALQNYVPTYVNYEPYSYYTLQFQPFGEFNITRDLLGNPKHDVGSTDYYFDLYITVEYNYTSGIASLWIGTAIDNHIRLLANTNCNLALPTVGAGTPQDDSSKAAGAMSTALLAASAVQGTFNPAALLAAFKTTGTPALPTLPRISGGSYHTVSPYPSIISTEYGQLSIDPALQGRALMRRGQLVSYTGFTKISDVHVDIDNVTEAERLEIERLLKEGVEL